MLYAGRRELGKNVPLLIDYFCRYKENNDSGLKLILIGSGAVNIPRKYKTEIIDLGFIPKQDKYDAYAAATVLCQPSINESFSIVIMESWLCGTPVLVHADCAVTKDHCIQSNGGLYFSNYEEFEECINFYLDNPELSNKLAENGKKYVKDNYNWAKIVERYKAFFSPSRYAIDSTVSKVTVSIIILHHSGEDYTINCIKSILSQTYHDFEIIVVASKDRRKIDENVSEFKNNSRIRFVLNDEDLGASWARNKGVDKSEGEYIVFLDNDTIVDKNWLKYLVEKLKSDAKIGTVTPKILSMDDPEVVLSCGGYINYQGYGADYGAYRIDKYYKPSHTSVFFSTSCCFIIRKELFFELGKFDEEVNFFGEDLDFTSRSSLIDLNNIIEPRSIIYHHRTKTDDDSLKIWQLDVQNRTKNTVEKIGGLKK
jgi:GT2 family glycosyltransferase